MNEVRLRQQLCQLTHQLWARGLIVADAGLLSVELHRRRYLATPAGARRASLEPEGLVCVDLGGENIQGGPGFAPERWRPHRLAYQLDAELETPRTGESEGEPGLIRATALTTPPHLLALMRAGRQPLPLAGFAHPLPLVEASDDDALRRGLQRHGAVAIHGAGLLTAGATLDAVVNLAERIEHVATIELALLRMGDEAATTTH
ncbi:MAG: class II aldolase/adducin family protein [Phycisphaeraceae bacterium]